MCQSETGLFLVNFAVSKVLMRNIRLYLLAFILQGLIFPLNPAFSQSQNFDAVSAPKLPFGWLSSSTTAGAKWVTTSFESDSAPNSAVCAGPAIASRTMLYAPAFFLPKVPTSISFRQHFFFEKGSINYFNDGGRIYFIPSQFESYGENFEWTNQGGSFVQGGYNAIISSPSSFISGGAAWGGDSVNYITTIASLPLGSASNVGHIAWALQTDNSNSEASTWSIDSITLSPSIDLQLTQSSNPNPPLFNNTLVFTSSVYNPSAIAATNVKLHQTLPYQTSFISAQADRGTVTNGAGFTDLTVATLPANSSATLTIRLTVPTLVGPGAYIEPISGPGLFYHPFPVGKLSFTPDPAVGINTFGSFGAFDFFPPTDDGCENQAIGSLGVGNLGFASNQTCSLETKILTLQTAGGLGAFISSSNDNISSLPGSGSGITIPGFLVAKRDFDYLQGLASSGEQMKLAFLPNTLVSLASVTGDQFDPNSANNFASFIQGVDHDADGDGVGDSVDGCSLDPAKTGPGVCGCGILDTDSNANGVTDCLGGQDLGAQLAQITAILKKIKKTSNNKAKKVLKANIANLKSLLLAFVNFSTNQQSFIHTNSAKPLSALVRSVNKSTLKALNVNARKFSSNKKNALKSIKTLQNSLSQ